MSYPLSVNEKEEVKFFVREKIECLLSDDMFADFTETELRAKRVELFQKYFDEEYTRRSQYTPSPAPPQTPLYNSVMQEDVADAINNQTQAIQSMKFSSPLKLEDVRRGLALRI